MKNKLLLLVVLLFFTVFSNAQINNNAFTISLNPQDLGTCGGTNNTTEQASITGKKATMNTLRFTYDLPDGVEYVPGSVVIDSQSGSGDFTVVEDNITNLNAPVFKIERPSNANWAINDNVTFSITRTGLCEAVAYLNSGGLFKDKHCIDYIDNGNNRNACDNDEAVSSYDLLAASLSLQSISTITANVGDNVSRNVTLTQGGNGSITFFNYYIVVGSSVDDAYQLSYNGTNLTPVSTSADTLFYEFDLTQAPFAGTIGGDDNFDNGESIVFTENFTIEDCGETNIKHHAYWGCSFGENCQESAPQTGSINFGANVPNIKVTRTDGSAYVDVCNGIRYKIKIENTSTTAGSDAIDVLINIGLGHNSSPLTTYSSNPFWAFDYYNTRAVSNFQFVGGAVVTPDNYTSTIYPTRGSGYTYAFPPNYLTSDPDGAGVGLEDLDGDGYYDDLAPGASTELEFDFTVNPKTDCGTGNYYYMEWEHLYFDALAKDQCGNPRLTDRVDINYFNLARDYSGHPSEFDTPSDVDTDSDFDVKIKPSVYTGGAGSLQCQGHNLFSNDANSVWTVTLTVPAGITLQAGAPSEFSQSGNTITYTTTNMNSGYFEEWVDFPLHLDCATYTAGGGGSTFSIDYKTHISCDCFDLDMHCGTFPTFHGHCTSGCSGPTILDLDAHRTSAGWTDHTMTTKVDLDTIPESDLNKYLAGDTMQISTYATIHSYSADNLYLDITYTTTTGGGDADIISYIDGNIVIYNQSSGTYTSVTALTSNPTRVSSGNQHTVTFDLTPYRTLISNENYDSGDTIFLNLNYVFSKNFNTETYFKLDNFRGNFYHDNSGTKVYCDTYGDAVHYGRVGYSGSNGTYTTQECTPVYLYNYLTHRANFGDLHPNEYRPVSHWDSTVVELPQGARFTGVALWNTPGTPSIANGMITYTQRGNTLVFYPDRNAGFYDPDQTSTAWYRFYVQVKGTCESNDGNNPFTSTHYFKDFAYTASNDTTFTNNPNFNYTPPSYLVQSPNPTVNGDANIADFDIRLDNTATTDVDYNWLMFEPNPNITIIGAYDITSGSEVAITMHQAGGYTWAECGSIASGSHSIIRFKGEFSNCSNQTVTFKHGWDCDAYPTDFASLTTACYKDSVNINLEPKTAQIQMNITDQPTSSVNLCNDFNIELDLLSVQVADATNPYVTFTAPSGLSGLTVGGADGKIDVEYPRNSGDIQAVTYSTSGNTVTINLMEHTAIANSSGIMGTANASSTDERVAHITVDLQATCDYISNTPITFKAFATSPCGDPAAGNGIRAISNNIQITGATAPYDVFSTITLPDDGTGSFGMNGCGTVDTINIASTILNGTTGSSDSAKVTLPVELEYVPGSFVNNGANVAVFDRIEVNSGITDIYIKYPSGVPDGGVVDYSFSVQTKDSICNDESQVDIVNYVNVSGLSCGGTSCGNTQVSTGFSYENMPVKKPSLVSAGLQSGVLIDNTDYSLTVKIANNSIDAIAGYEYNVYCSDASGQITGASIGSGNFSQAITENDTITEILNFTATSCGVDSVIVEITPSGTNCMCNALSFIVPYTKIYSPDANTDNVTTVEDTTSFVIDVQANDTDADGDPLTTSIVSGPTSGGTAVVLNGDSISYTPVPNWCGTDTIIYQVCDATPLCDVDTVFISVTCVSDGGPNTTEDIVTANEDDTNVSIDVLANDNDPDGGPLTLSSIVSQPSNGTAVISGNEISYTPNADWCGQDTIIYQACDDEPLCANDTVFITVNCVNDPPTQGNETMTIDEDDPLTTSTDLTVNNIDPEGTTTTLTTIVSSTGGGTTTINGNSIDYTPAANFNGIDTVIYTVCDAGVGSPATQCVTDTLFITVNPVNDPPVVDNENIGTVEDTPVSGDLTDSGDSDLESSLTANTTPISGPSNGSITINSDGTYTYTPNTGFIGNDQVVVEICDNGLPLPAICVYDTIFITVTNNQTPIDNGGNGNENMTTTEDSTAINSPNVLVNNSDPEGDAMNVVIVDTGNGTATYNSADSTIAYTPNPNFCGQDTVLYDVCDAYSCNHDTLFVNVTCVNDAPTGGNETASVTEDTTTANLGNVLNNNSDIEGDSLSVTVTGTSTNGGTVVYNPSDSTISYTPQADFCGQDTILYDVCDNGTPSACITDTMFVTVTCVNDAPTGGNETATVDEDNSITIDLDDNNNDVDGDTLTVSFPNGNIGTGGGTFTDNGDGTVTYTPLPDYYGNDTLIYTVCDPTPACVTDTVIVTVNPINDAPIVDNEHVGTMQDTPFTGDLTDVGDSDIDGTTLTANTTPISGPNNGSITINPDGSYTYTPNLGFLGLDTIVVEICDDGYPLPAECVYDTIFITVTDNNTPLDSAGGGNENMTTIEDSGASNSPNVLNNNYDIEGDSMNVVIINTGNGTATYNPADSTIAYTPNPNFCGQDTVLYDVCDSYTCNHDTLFVDVTCVNDAPTGGNETATMDEDDPAILIDLDDNNNDVDGDTLTVSFPNGNIGTGGGTFTDNGDGTVTYSPLPDYYGNDTLIYTVCDPTPACVTDTVIVTVNPINDAPIVDNEHVGTMQDTPFTGDLTDVGDSDVDGTLTADTIPVYGPNNGAITINPDGSYTYTPNLGFLGLDTIVVEICDDGYPLPVECVYDTIFIIVTDNNTPLDSTGGGNENMTTIEDSGASNSPNVLNNNYDIEGDSMNVVIINTGNGTATYNPADSTIAYTPNPNFCGQDTVLYDVCDSYTCNHDTLFVDVTCVNDAPVATINPVYETTPEDTPITICIDATDVEGDAYEVTEALVTPTNGIATGFADGDSCFTYTPNPNFNGQDSLVVTICDSGACDTVVVYINVTPLNDPPDAQDTISEFTEINTPVTICIPATDIDGDTLGICSIDSMPTNGVISNYTDSTLCFTYTPDTNYLGNDTMSVIVCDGNGGSDTVNIIITVTPPNNPPVIADDTISTTTPVNTPVTICIPATDADGDTLGICSINPMPANGVVSNYTDSTLCFTYTPDTNYVGGDTMSVIVCDGNGGSDTVVVVVDVTPITNNPPVIADDTISTTTPVNTPVTICIPATDADGDTLGICSINPMPANGVVSNYTDSTLCFTYTPNSNYVGGDTMSVIVCDGNGGSDTVVVVIDVIPATNNSPVVANDTINTTTPVNTPITVCISTTDADGDTLGICGISPMPENGVVTSYTDSTLCFTYTPNSDYVGSDIMSIIICDGNGGSDTVVVVIDVTPTEEIVVPGGFSPNGDGTNDVFVIKGISSNDNTKFTIYNRWGNKVYEASPYKNNWDGTNMFGVSIGTDLPVGTYFYILEIDGELKKKGYIYLNR